jgi:hypothetical protein
MNERKRKRPRETEGVAERPGLRTPAHVKMDEAVAEYVRGSRERLHDVLRSAFDQAVTLMKKDAFSETRAAVLGALWVLCVTNEEALPEPRKADWRKRREEFQRAGRRFFDGIGAPRPAPPGALHRTVGGYRPEDGDDMLRAVARDLGVHTKTTAGVTRELTSLIANASVEWLDDDIRDITNLLVGVPFGVLRGNEVRAVRDSVRNGIDAWVRQSQSFTVNTDREERAMSVLNDILIDCGMSRKAAHNAVYAAVSMKETRRGTNAARRAPKR